jgi:chromosome segregation ATPase
MDNAILKVNDFGLKNEVEKLFSKIKVLVEKYNNAKDENKLLKEKLKELENSVSEFKLEISGKSSELLSKDREITDLKNKLLDERKNKISAEDKSHLKSRIRELMVRLDAHLEQKANNNF